MSGAHRKGAAAYDTGRRPASGQRAQAPAARPVPCEPGTGCRVAQGSPASWDEPPRRRRHERACDGNCGTEPPASLLGQVVRALMRRRAPRL